jgi:hypothetical protein
VFEAFNDEWRKGFHVKFANGWTVSVQFGRGNYCENRCANKNTSSDAEIAAWNKEGKWYRFDGDDVKGYCKPEEVVQFMQMISQQV